MISDQCDEISNNNGDNSSIKEDDYNDDNSSIEEDERNGNNSFIEEDDHGLSEEDVPVEQFIAPDFDDLDFESDHEYPDTNVNFNDS